MIFRYIQTTIVGLLLAGCSEQSSAEEMIFQLVESDDNPPWISADGVITKTTPARFDQFINDVCKERPSCDLPGEGIGTIAFNSRGGDLIAALSLGERIRDLRLNTALARIDSESSKAGPISGPIYGGVCESACVYAYAGGVSRQLTLFNNAMAGEWSINQPTELTRRHSAFGVHQFFAGQAFSSEASIEVSNTELNALRTKFRSAEGRAQYFSRVLTTYLQANGVNAQLFLEASAIAPDDILYLTEYELHQMNLVTTDILWWRQDKSFLRGFHSLDNFRNAARARISCGLDAEKGYFFELNLEFDAQRVLGRDPNRDDVDYRTLGDWETNGMIIRYGGRTLVSENRAPTQISGPHHYSYARTELSASALNDIIYSSADFLEIEFIGDQFSQYPFRSPIRIFLNDDFKEALKTQFADGKNCILRNPQRSVSAASGIRSGAQQPQADRPSLRSIEGLTDITFGAGDASIAERDTAILRKLANWLHKHDDENIIIIGYADDDDGEFQTRQAALQLGSQRALAIQKYLVSNGIRSWRITTTSYGKERPIRSPNSLDYEPDANRTVRIRLQN